MNRSMRRLVAAVIFVVIFTVVGTVGGFFNVHDLINRAAINIEENEYGGDTTTKATSESNTATFIKADDKLWTTSVDDSKPYLIQVAKDGNDEVVSYYYVYLVDKSYDECVKFYEDLLDNEEVKVVDETTYIETILGGYEYQAKVDKDGNQVEVYVTINKQQ